ncbi:M28 family peptidase, partial [Spirochaetota bacterium]
MQDNNILPSYINSIKELRSTIIANILLAGQIPAPTFHEKRRVKFFKDRLAEVQVDHCSVDNYGNPIGIIKGSDPEKPPIFLVAHMDTIFGREVDHNYTVKKNTIAGPGILDNSAGVGVLLSMPEVLHKLGITFSSDIALLGTVKSMGKGNLRGIKFFVDHATTPIRCAVCIEGGELGRLNYFSEGMMRLEISCDIPVFEGWQYSYKPNAILILNEIINEILSIRLPQKPRTRIIIGKISGGMKYGEVANNASLGFEVRSDSEKVA